jgi:hypothetical protein
MQGGAMSVSTLENSAFPSSVRGAISAAWRENRPLSLLVLGSFALMIISVLGLIIDPRIITGAPAWMKPAKFGISVVIYGATLLWLLTFLKDRPRFVAIVSWLALAGFGIELALIAMQVVRSTTSHFNYETAFDATVFNIMAGVIVAMWLLTLLVAILLFRRRFAAPSIVWGVRMGLIAALLGMAVAFLMPRPTPDQEAMMETAGSSPIIGAHSVGVPDGGPGLPIVGWSTTGGDLRVAHFFGLHGLQALIVIGWLLARFGPSWLSARARAQLTIVAGLAWIGLTLLLTWQARRAQPLIAPDGTTLLALGALVAATVVAGTLVLLVNREPASAQALTA